MELLPVVDVVGVGLNATDTLIQLSQFPARGSKLEYDTEMLQPGGQVASAMMACQSWGLQTRYVGKLGSDEAADLHEREFSRCGVEWHTIRVADAPSPKSLILVDADGERTVLCRRDERLTLKPAEMRREWVTQARTLLIDGHDTEAAIQAATWARAEGIPVVADLDEVYPGVEEMLALVDYLIVSRSFPSRATGEPDLAKALCILQGRFGSTVTAATLGTEGVLAWNGRELYQACAYCVPVIDTTGAGDIFHAGFIYALLQDWDLQRQLDYACAAAALNCTAQGARGGIRPVAAIQELISNGTRYPAVQKE